MRRHKLGLAIALLVTGCGGAQCKQVDLLKMTLTERAQLHAACPGKTLAECPAGQPIAARYQRARERWVQCRPVTKWQMRSGCLKS